VVFLGLLSCGGEVREAEALPRLLEAPDFQLTNSEGQTVSKSGMLGKVWLVDFIFTRCTGPCPMMTQKAVTLQQTLGEQGLLSPQVPFYLVSISVDPGYDTPEVFKQYAATWAADTASWHFLTGPPDSTLALIRDGFKIVAQPEGSSTGTPMIMHSTNFLLVDRSGWVRRIAKLNDPDFTPSLVRDIRRLLAETEP